MLMDAVLFPCGSIGVRISVKSREISILALLSRGAGVFLETAGTAHASDP
jgi:hypothetical protein